MRTPSSANDPLRGWHLPFRAAALGATVRDRRRRLDMSQEALAAAGLHRTYVGGIDPMDLLADAVADRPNGVMRDPSRRCSIDAGSAAADDERAMEPWVHSNARTLLGGLGTHAQVFEVYSAGDSGEGCEVILFTTPTTGGLVPWTARVEVRNGLQRTVCTVGW